MAELIMLDGQVLNGSDRLGDWKTTSIEGWWDSPDPKGEEEERPNADGDFDLEVFYKARYVTITGRLLAQSHNELHQAINRFSGLVQKRARLQVSGHGPAQWLEVKRASGFSMAPITDTFAQWQVRLKAVDPRKFGDANGLDRQGFPITPGQTATVFHRGNYAATPVITVTGDFPNGYTITGPTGKTYVVTVALAPGTTHTIDMSHGLLRTNQSYYTGGVGTADVWTIPPGQQITMGLTAPSGSGTAVIDVLDTYI